MDEALSRMVGSVVTDARMPRNEIRLVSVNNGGELSIHTLYNVGVPREDCPFPGCQLSAGHPPHHCCADPDSSRYAIVDDDGTVLRVL